VYDQCHIGNAEYLNKVRSSFAVLTEKTIYAPTASSMLQSSSTLQLQPSHLSPTSKGGHLPARKSTELRVSASRRSTTGVNARTAVPNIQTNPGGEATLSGGVFHLLFFIASTISRMHVLLGDAYNNFYCLYRRPNNDIAAAFGHPTSQKFRRQWCNIGQM
jgi:hypothetical protein